MSQSSSSGELSQSAFFNLKGDTLPIGNSTTGGASAIEDLVGQTIDGKYRVLKQIGSGGMGCVYLAQHLLLDKQVALKTFKSLDQTESERLRFKREAQSIARLSHPNIVQVFDFGYTNNGTLPYYTMELLDGSSLKAKIAKSGALSERDVLTIFTQVCLGLSVAHHKGIIHRDLKPDNFFLHASSNPAESVKIIDFGIASLALPSSDAQRLTSNGVIFGSPLYMSPEQAMGQMATERSDIYSCGCALYEALTGEPPYLGASAYATLSMHQSAPLPSLKSAYPDRDFASGWQRLISTMLAKEQKDRYQSADEVLSQLQTIKANLSKREQASSFVSIKPEQSSFDADPNKESASTTRKPLPAIMTGGVALLVVAAGVAGWMVTRPHLPAASTTQAVPVKPVEPAQPAEPKSSTRVQTGRESISGGLSDNLDNLPQVLQSRKVPNRISLALYKITPQALDMLADTHALNFIDFTDCRLANDSLDKLQNLPLLGMSFDASDLNDVGVANIAKCKSLVNLSVSYTPITDAGLVNLNQLKNLESLSLERTNITDAGLSSLTSLHKLKFLAVKDVNHITARGLSGLTDAPIYTLDLGSNPIGDDAIPYLIKMKGLHHLDLGRTYVTASGIRQLCEANDQFEEVNLLDCERITRKELHDLVKRFPNCHFSYFGGSPDRNKIENEVPDKAIPDKAIPDKAIPNKSSHDVDKAKDKGK